MSQRCPSCHGDVDARARFCRHCGMRLDGRLADGTELNQGAYRILRSMSKGGMGAVYLAEDRGAFGRLCVIKQMLPYYDPANTEERRRAEERFEEEGRTLAALSHPGIPKIYAFFEEHGRFYLVMEYIRGENLESYVTHENGDGRMVPGHNLPQEEIIRHALGVCRIVEYLHGQPRPVVHQDIKPANIVLEDQLGEVRLLDFGTARAKIPPGALAPRPTGPRGQGEGGPSAQRRRSSVYGTDGYAAPEQYRGQPEPRSDVFSLAATVYHLLTDDDPRDHPFKWPQIEALPRDLRVALGRALRTDPEQRSTARELYQALEALSAPHRALQAFTFPGGTRIRTVAALPTLCDEHWDAARSLLCNGDFGRWLRDINRHDLVLSAKEIVATEKNRDAALEKFIHHVDPGVKQPRLAVDPPTVDLGPVAREAALLRRVTALNVTRGYAEGHVTSSQPWIEVYPNRLHLWAGIPADIRINVRAEHLPFRAQQRGTVRIEAEGIDSVEVPVTARVSLAREAWRVTWRTISAAVPESWAAMRQVWETLARMTLVAYRVVRRHPVFSMILWVLLGTGVGAALYYHPLPVGALWGVGAFLRPDPEWLTHLRAWWGALLLALFYAVRGLVVVPLLIPALWLAVSLLGLIVSAAWGAARGAWKSLFR